MLVFLAAALSVSNVVTLVTITNDTGKVSQVCSECRGTTTVETVCPKCSGKGRMLWRVSHTTFSASGVKLQPKVWRACSRCYKGLSTANVVGSGKVQVKCPMCKGRGK